MANNKTGNYRTANETPKQDIASAQRQLAPLMEKWEKANHKARAFDYANQKVLPVINNRTTKFYRNLTQFDAPGMTPATAPIVQKSENLHMAADAVSREYQVKYETILGWEDSGLTACGMPWSPRTIKIGFVYIPAMRATDLIHPERSARPADGFRA